MSIHLSSVTTYPCFILYVVSKWNQTIAIHLSGLSTFGGGLTVLVLVLTLWQINFITVTHQLLGESTP